MPNERDKWAWADIERRLRHDPAPLIVPLLLPLLSVMEMRPAAVCVDALVATTVVLPRWVQRGARSTGRSGTGPAAGQ
jgi:hypothetical protein